MYLEDRGKVFGLFNVGEVAAPSVPIPAERGVVGIEGAAATVGVAAPSGGDWEVGLGRVGQAQKERFFGVEIDARGGSGGGGGDCDGDGLGHHHVWNWKKKGGAAAAEWMLISFSFCFYLYTMWIDGSCL